MYVCLCLHACGRLNVAGSIYTAVFLGKIFSGGGKAMFREIEGGRGLELKLLK